MAEPKVRFKKDDGSSYPAWKEYSISDLFTKIGNKNKDGQNTNVITNSAEFGLIPQRDYFDKDIAVEGNTGNYTIIQTGDFVYNPRKSSYAPMGPFNCYRLEEDGIVSPLYSCLRPKGVLSPEYLLWYFQTDKWYGYVNDHGAQNGARHDRVGMTDKILMGIPVTAPCEEEQQKIADFLPSVDEVITASEEEVANLETQKKAVMKKIFSQEVRFKKMDGSDFPEWEEMPLGTVAGVYDGTHQTPEYVAEGIKFVSVENISDLYGSNKYITEDAFMKQYKNNAPQKGDVLMTRIGDIGTAALVSSDEQLAYYVSLALLKSSSVIRPNYLVQAIASDFFQSELWIRTLHTAYPKKINKEDIGKCMIQIPCLEEQRLIADFLSDFDEAIAAAKKELELWKELKKGLLQQMFV